MKKSELKKWAKAHMVGVENTTLPSFSPDLSELDEAGIRHDVQQAIKHGFFSTLVATETGLSFEESKRFVSIVCDEAKGKILVSTTLLFDSHDKNMAMLEHAEKAGAHSVLLGYPANWYAKSSDEVYQRTREMADATNLGIVLYPSPHYNFQRLHNSGFPLDALSKLADIDNVVAIKAGEPGLIADCLHRLSEKILVNCPVERFLPLMVMGFGQQWMGAGCYEVFQSPETRYLVEYFRLLREKKVDQAMQIYWKLAPARNIFESQFMPTSMLGTYNWTQQKYYQWCVGGNGGLTRQPAMKIHQHEMEATKMAFRMIDINPREPDEEFYVGRVNYGKTRKGSDTTLAVDVTAVAFTDKDDRAVPLSAFKGDIVILHGGGQGAIEEQKRWSEAFGRKKNGFKVIEAAFVGKLPMFVPKKMVKKAIVENAPGALIDFDGEPIKTLGVADTNVHHVFVIDRSGQLRFKLTGGYSEASLEKVLAQAEALS